MSKNLQDHQRDLQLVQSILDGSVDAWHQFVEEYSGLLLSVIRRHVFGDEDDVRAVFVEVLGELHEKALATYSGRASLATWLALIARGRAIDDLRSRIGRTRAPQAVRCLPELENRIFWLHHVGGCALPDLRARLSAEGFAADLEAVLAAVDRVEENLDSGVRTRLSYGCAAADLPGITGRELHLRDEAALTAEERYGEQGVEAKLEAAIRGEQAGLVRDALGRLEADEREVLRLRFEEHKDATAIAAELGLDSRKRVYSLTERAIARMRRWLGG